MDEIFFHETKSRIIYGDDHYTLREISKKTPPSRVKVVLRRFGICLAFFIIGIGLGFWSCTLKYPPVQKKVLRKAKPEFYYHQDIATEINSKEIEKSLRFVSV